MPYASGEKLRCVGSALSPNGLAFSPEGMLSLALLDQVLHIDKQKQQITVQAGARVQEVAHAYIKQDTLFHTMLVSALSS